MVYDSNFGNPIIREASDGTKDAGSTDSTLQELVAEFLNQFATHAVKVCPAVPNEDYWAGVLLVLLSQHGVVQLAENQDFSPFAGIPKDFYKVHPLVEAKK